MATRGAIAGIRADAVNRITAAEAELVGRLGIEEEPAAPPARQPELREAYQLERHARVLERVLAALPEED